MATPTQIMVWRCPFRQSILLYVLGENIPQILASLNSLSSPDVLTELSDENKFADAIIFDLRNNGSVVAGMQ